MKHIHFVIHRLKSLLLFIVNIFSDCSLPLSRLIIPNPHGKFKLEGRNVIFEGGYYPRSLILKEGISNEILEVFVLLIFEVIMIFLFVFVFHKGK
jgi:hypothetical protein